MYFARAGLTIDHHSIRYRDYAITFDKISSYGSQDIDKGRIAL
jgi:hypothetical protein